LIGTFAFLLANLQAGLWSCKYSDYVSCGLQDDIEPCLVKTNQKSFDAPGQEGLLEITCCPKILRFFIARLSNAGPRSSLRGRSRSRQGSDTPLRHQAKEIWEYGELPPALTNCNLVSSSSLQERVGIERRAPNFVQFVSRDCGGCGTSGMLSCQYVFIERPLKCECGFLVNVVYALCKVAEAGGYRTVFILSCYT
jgi:hypothetical protein